MKILELPLLRELKKMASFGAIGLVNAVIDYAVFLVGFWFILKPQGIDDNWIPLAILNIAAWAVAVTNSYYMNTKITFKRESEGELSLKNYGRFAASGVIGLIANTVTVLLLKSIMPVIFAKIIAVGVSFVINFTIARLYVFK